MSYMDEPQAGGLIDKKFIYIIICILIIISGALIIINRIDIMGQEFRGGSWYIYCDLEHRSCSCNVYGIYDEPRSQQMILCADFMRAYMNNEYTLVNNTAPIISDINAEVVTPN